MENNLEYHDFFVIADDTTEDTCISCGNRFCRPTYYNPRIKDRGFFCCVCRDNPWCPGCAHNENININRWLARRMGVDENE